MYCQACGVVGECAGYSFQTVDNALVRVQEGTCRIVICRTCIRLVASEFAKAFRREVEAAKGKA